MYKYFNYLIQLADHLDKINLHKEAGVIDNFLKLAQEYPKISVLRRVIDALPSMGLEEAKKFLVDFLKETRIRIENKEQMIKNILEQTNMKDLIYYAWMSLLAKEVGRVIR